MTESALPLEQHLRQAADAEGFTLFGITPAVASAGFPRLVQWIESGMAGDMNYFALRREAYQHPDSVLSGVRSIITLAFPYSAADARALAASDGRVARYAWDQVDYHDIIHPKLKRLCRLITVRDPDASARGVVDTAPLQEREIAELAGLGWRGKNTLLLNKHLGSYFFLACVLTNVELPYDSPHASSHCGTCRACLDACPTEAFPEPGVLDATKCISYLTIEHREPIPRELRAGIGHWLFGCDVCQEVCPWNRKPANRSHRTDDAMDGLELTSLFSLDDDEFRTRFRRTPLWRARRRGILRNASIVLGNVKPTGAVSALVTGLNDPESLVRGAAAWALGQIGGITAKSALHQRLVIETDDGVRHEIEVSSQRLIDSSS